MQAFQAVRLRQAQAHLQIVPTLHGPGHERGRIEEAERKVEILIKDKDGKKRTRTFDIEEHAEAGQDNGDVEG